MIPKIIMQTWKSNIVPQHWKTSPTSIKQFMPKWKYILMTDEDNRNFVIQYFPDYLQFYDNLKYPIQRADVIRYMFLYIYGGIYLDLDIELTGPIDEIFENREMETWLLKAPKNLANQYTNFLMASTAKNEFWLLVLNECKKELSWWQKLLPHFVISYQTGLGALTRAVKHWNKPIALLPFESFVPCDYCNENECTKPYSYTKFLKGQSWNNIDTYIFNFCICNPLLLCLIIFFLFSSIYFFKNTRFKLRQLLG